jgi:predicted transcriptional regulator
MVVLLEDVLLHVLRENMNPLSLKELQVKVSPRRVTPIMLAASLNRLCKRGQVVRELVQEREGRAHYVYSAKRTKLVSFSKRGDL